MGRSGIPDGLGSIPYFRVGTQSTGKSVQLIKFPKPSLSISEESIFVNSEKSEIEFDPTTGLLKRMKFNGQEIFISSPRLNVWRAPTDNDGIKAWSGQENKSLGGWLKTGIHELKINEQSCRVLQLDEVPKFQEKLELPGQNLSEEVTIQMLLNLSVKHVYGCGVTDDAFVNEMLCHIFPAYDPLVQESA